MVYGLSDLHLDYTKNKSMEIFGDGWDNYEEKIFKNWADIVNEDDLVLIPGDICWAMKIEDAYIDLLRIDKQKGRKILLKGNHDYWWQSINKLNNLGLTTISFLQNNSYEWNGLKICGARGWVDKTYPEFTEQDEKIFNRELIRFEISIQSIDDLQDKDSLIAMFHYPPFHKDGSGNEFAFMLEKYGIKTCIYGHLRGPGFSNAVKGKINGINYHCLSGDYLKFIPKLLFRR